MQYQRFECEVVDCHVFQLFRTICPLLLQGVLVERRQIRQEEEDLNSDTIIVTNGQTQGSINTWTTHKNCIFFKLFIEILLNNYKTETIILRLTLYHKKITHYSCQNERGKTKIVTFKVKIELEAL